MKEVFDAYKRTVKAAEWVYWPPIQDVYKWKEFEELIHSEADVLITRGDLEEALEAVRQNDLVGKWASTKKGELVLLMGATDVSELNLATSVFSPLGRSLCLF